VLILQRGVGVAVPQAQAVQGGWWAVPPLERKKDVQGEVLVARLPAVVRARGHAVPPFYVGPPSHPAEGREAARVVVHVVFGGVAVPRREGAHAWGGRASARKGRGWLGRKGRGRVAKCRCVSHTQLLGSFWTASRQILGRF
jgi:hypothetical protein